MSKTNYKYIFYLVCIILLLFILSIGIIQFVKNYTGFIENKTQNDDVIYKSDTNTVIIKNLLGVDDYFGRSISDNNAGAYGYLNFSVVNNTDKKKDYQIFIKKNDVFEKEINSNYLRFYLTDSLDNALGMYKNNKLPSYIDLNFITDKPNSKLIYFGKLEANEKKNFTLRVWITSNYIISDEEEVFSFEIGARSV